MNVNVNISGRMMLNATDAAFLSSKVRPGKPLHGAVMEWIESEEPGKLGAWALTGPAGLLIHAKEMLEVYYNNKLNVSAKKKNVDNLLRIAMTIEGPHDPQGRLSDEKLWRLREIRWSMLSKNEKNMRKNEAKEGLAYLVDMGEE